MQFDSTLTISGKPFWEETHMKHVRTIREKYAISAKKPKPLIENKIESKHGQTKWKSCSQL